jgi:hypothetical protein
MRNIVLLIAVLSLVGCTKKRVYYCTDRYQTLEAQICMVGFTREELDTINLSEYKAQTGFTQFVNSYTFTDTEMIFKHDTVYLRRSSYNGGFFAVKAGSDYEVTLPAVAGNIYRITGVSYRGDTIQVDSTHEYTSENPCSGGHNYYMAPDSIAINGQPMKRSAYSPAPPSFFFLHR